MSFHLAAAVDQGAHLITGWLTFLSATLLARLKTDMVWILWKCTYSREVYISWKFPWDHPLERRDPAGRNNRGGGGGYYFFITSKYRLDSITLLLLTVKHVGGGSSFIRTTAAGGTGKTPPGTGCKPGAVGVNTGRWHQRWILLCLISYMCRLVIEKLCGDIATCFSSLSGS